MSGNDEEVLLNLNFPGFQSAFFDLDVSDVKKVLKTMKKLSAMTWNDVFRDHGLKWEEIKSMRGRYSIRLSQSCRAGQLDCGRRTRAALARSQHRVRVAEIGQLPAAAGATFGTRAASAD